MPKPNHKTEVQFDTTPLVALDQFALLACQTYNFGNATDWFGDFRGGYYGLFSRLFGVSNHYRLAHAWLPTPRMPAETEYHVASMLFGMDSAIECFTYMLNALGFAVMPSDFHDVTDERALRRIAPLDILGVTNGGRLPLAGYAALFPTLQAHWQAHRALLTTIVEQHDVSKHREVTYSGGHMRDDPPTGFYGAHAGNKALEAFLAPHAEILLTHAPKQPKASRVPIPYEDAPVLETIVEDFRVFLDKSCLLARDDALTNVQLAHNQFQR